MFGFYVVFVLGFSHLVDRDFGWNVSADGLPWSIVNKSVYAKNPKEIFIEPEERHAFQGQVKVGIKRK